MGEQKVSILKDKSAMQRFMRHLLKDVQALKYMLENDWFEKDVTRIGAEQEMVLVDTKTYKPAPIAMEALEKMKEYRWVETELAKFNLETNLQPRVFEGKCLSGMEKENRHNLNTIKKTLKSLGANHLLTGILPTLRKFDLEMHNLTPMKRYDALMRAITEQLIGNSYELRLTGIDEILVKHDSPLLEACNTSFQVHLQVAPKDFVKMYNISQALAAPIMAIAANSPVVFGKRLWHETRIALFQQSVDTRTTHKHMRERSPRVTFGSDWLQNSVLEIYKEDIARFRVLLAGDVEEDSLEMIQQGKTPKLRALQVHNSTVYRWNRPCFGVSPNGKPHLRIENRVLPSGPTVVDEFANAAFWLGCMEGMALEIDDIREVMSWEDARDNFGKAARFGIDSKFTWFKDEKITASDLVLNYLLPLARKGLKARKIDSKDIKKYLSIIEARAKNHMNGARWTLRAFTQLKKQVSTDEAVSVLTACMLQNQHKGKPVHTWELPKLSDLKEYRPAKIKVEEFMVTDLFTVRKEDIIEFVAEMMDWRKTRYLPVEDSKGRLVGLITARMLLKEFAKKQKLQDQQAVTVEEVMVQNPVVINHDASIVEAMNLMKKSQIGCLPVIHDEELVGIITEKDFLGIAGRLIERLEEDAAV
ncbi:MAG: glutamate-cysteine ligase family protein [Bacteroidota bacterium]